MYFFGDDWINKLIALVSRFLAPVVIIPVYFSRFLSVSTFCRNFSVLYLSRLDVINWL